LNRIATDELRGIFAQCFDRAVELFEPSGLIGPDEALEIARPLIRCDVDRRVVDPDPRPGPEAPAEELGGNCTTFTPRKRQLRARVAPLAALVPTPVAVPNEVEACTRPDLQDVHLVYARTLRNLEEAGQQHPRSLHLVRLHGALRH